MESETYIWKRLITPFWIFYKGPLVGKKWDEKGPFITDVENEIAAIIRALI